MDGSVGRWGNEYVDLYEIHRLNYETPIEETLEALHAVVKAGKALYIGASSMFAWQFASMLYTADRLGFTRFVTMQNHYNLIYREEEREMAPLCHAEAIGLLPWSPLARRLLAGSRRAATQHSTLTDYPPKLSTQEADDRAVDGAGKGAKDRSVAAPPHHLAC